MGDGGVEGAKQLDTWPDWFPAECPPAEAGPATGDFYRLVANDTVVREDFLSQRELVIEGIKKRVYWDDEAEGMAVACSIHEAVEDAAKTRQAVAPLRNRRIALGQVDGDGRLLHTPSALTESHHSWWRRLDDEAWKTFAVVA